MRKILGILGAAFVAANCYGSFQIQLDAGQLRANSSTALPTGSLLMFISAGANGVFDTVPTVPTTGPVNSALSPGQWTAGDDVLLSVMADPPSAQAFAPNAPGGINEVFTLFSINQQAPSSPGVPPDGQQIALLWFPQITYAQWQAGATPQAGMTFGFYNPTYWGNSTNNPDGGDSWIVYPNGVHSLNFFTTDDLGGSQPPLRGFGNNFIVAIPEPSSFALIGVGAALLPLLRRRKA